VKTPFKVLLTFFTCSVFGTSFTIFLKSVLRLASINFDLGCIVSKLFTGFVRFKNNNILSEEDYHFLASKESGIRGIRNIMTHRNAYQYCLEGTDGKALPLQNRELGQ